MVARGDDFNNIGQEKSWCDHCKKPWHTRDTCWKLHRKPANWKSKSQRANPTITEENQEFSINPGSVHFIKEQLEHIYKKVTLLLLNSLVVFLFLLTIDSGATDHMTGCSKMFSSYCVLQELTIGRMIGSAKERDDLYYFNDGPNLSKQCPNTCLNSTFVSQDHDIIISHYQVPQKCSIIWHYRLGHPSF
ncbi:hypothetical protein CR513_01809, partial [Mucuna pruriens]